MRRQWLGIWAGMFLGIVFLIAGISKIFAMPGNFTPFLLPGFLPSFLTQSLSITIPYFEVTIGALLIIGIAVKFTTILSGIMIAGFGASNIMLMTLGLASEPCNCFGGVAGGLSVYNALILDGVMAGMVLIIFLFYPSSFSNIKPWCLRPWRDTKTIEGIKV